MGESLMQVLEETIPKSMTPAVKEAWKETYQELSGDMIKGFTMVRRGSS
jgi:hemoglobin-like flavoprotein